MKISYDLASLIRHVELPVLDNHFSEEEIQLAVTAMPLDHAPGLDGFNGLFYKKCWPLISPDFKRLCKQFC